MTTPAREYLAGFGLDGFVGRFLAPADEPLRRGDRVVLRTPRGVEAGEILSESGPAVGRLVSPHVTGEVLRRAAGGDLVARPVGGLLARFADHVAASGRPLAVIDAEILLDGETVVVHVLPWGEWDGERLAVDLAESSGLRVILHDAAESAGERGAMSAADRGCGKSDCGSGGGSCDGCSTGGCSRKSVSSAEDLAVELAKLSGRVPLG